jgi:AcrR family transcriptional regulator
MGLYIINNIVIVMKEFSSTDEKIINATFGILQREGFTKATTKKIAAEAGVNEVTIFRNFQNKNNLVEITKEYYLQRYLEKMEEIFDFNEDDEIENYLQSNFIGILNRSENEYSIIKLAMEEVRNIPDKKTIDFKNH